MGQELNDTEQCRLRERSAAIQGPPPQPYDPLDASLIAMMIRSKVDVP